MANDNKIQLDIEISERSVDGAFKLVDERGTKSAKSSAVAFEEAFQQQEQVLRTTLQKLTNESKEYVRKSAQESAVVFREAFERQNKIYQASVKQNIDNAINNLTNAGGIRKSAAESASVFEEAFKKESDSFKPVEIPVNTAGGFQAVRSLTDVYTGLLLVKGGLDVVKKAAQEVFDVSLEGEKIRKVEARFEALRAQAGILSITFREDLVKSINGFVDDTELLRFASEAFVRIGNSAKSLPKVIEAARKSYQVFGGDILDISNRIVGAAETGNKRALKDIGLYTDLDGAVKRYARQLGTVPALLTESQKEQARLNAILVEADTRFAGVTAKAGQISSYTQLKTALNDLNDEFSKITNSKIGGVFQGLADAAKAVVKDITEGLARSRPAEGVAEITKAIENNKAKIIELKKEYASYGESASAIKNTLNLKILRLEGQVDNYILKLREARGEQLALAAKNEIAGKTGGDSGVQDELVRRRQEAANKLNELNKAVAQSEIQLAQDEFSRNATRANLEAIYYGQRSQQALQYETQKAELEKFFAENGATDEATRRASREALESQHVNNLLKIRGDYRQQLKAFVNDEVLDVTTAADAYAVITQSIGANFRNFSTSIKANLKEVGKAFTTTFRTQATQAIFAFAQGSKNAEEAAQGLFTGILNAMGEMLISQGLGFILQGAAFSYAGLPNGPALAGAGAAMVAFGATLAAISAANGGAVGAGNGGGGTAGKDTYTDNSNNQPSTPIVDTKPENPNTVVNVNTGPIFDRKDTGLVIADILKEQFEDNGIIIRSRA